MRELRKKHLSIGLVLAFLIFPGRYSVADVPVQLSIQHQPPQSAVAGDPLELDIQLSSTCLDSGATTCGSMMVGVNYLAPNGSVRSLPAQQVSADHPVRAIIPGDAVRFPTLSYWIEAFQTICSLGPSCADDETQYVQSRLPSTGSITLKVDHVLRMKFVGPDRSPAKNLEVVFAPRRNGRDWRLTTGEDGSVEFLLPRDEPWIKEVEASLGFAQFFISAFDAIPTEAPPDTTRWQVQGNGTLIGATFNLGTPVLSAADEVVQDRTFTLKPETAVFSTSATSDSTCVPAGDAGATCDERVGYIYDVDIPIANRVGGGAEMKSQVSYENSTLTTSTFLFKSGGDWAEAEGELGHQEEEKHRYTTLWKGPGANQKVLADWWFARDKTTTSYLFFYRETEKITPYHWTTGVRGETYTSRHDTARSGGSAGNYGPDCTVQHQGTHTSGSSEGHRIAYGISIGGSVYGLQAKTRWTKAESAKFEMSQTWVQTGTTYPHHHRFVRAGFVNPDEPECPRSHQSLVWTDSSNYNKENPREAAEVQRPGSPIWYI